MDILRKLHSILAPSAGPAVRSRPTLSRPEGLSPVTFEQALGDAISMDPVRQRAPIDTGSTAGAPVPVLPPNEDPPAPIAIPVVEVHDSTADHASTLEATIAAAGRATAAAAADAGPGAASEAAEPSLTGDSALGAGEATVTSFGPWSAVSFQGSGAQGVGIDGSPEAAAREVALKFTEYSDPTGSGVILNREGRLFNDAVAKGYVPNTPEGLATMLGYLSMGSFDQGGQAGRPASITTYFNSFFKSDVQAYG